MQMKQQNPLVNNDEPIAPRPFEDTIHPLSNLSIIAQSYVKRVKIYAGYQ
jgi:hypothetical protein